MPSSAPTKGHAGLLDEIRNHKGLKKGEPTKSKSADIQDHLQELKAQLDQRRHAVSGGGMASSLSSMIPEPESGDEDDFHEGISSPIVQGIFSDSLIST